MNEQEKALRGMIEFCQWLVPNAKQFGLEQSKSVAMISQAQTPDDIVNGMNSLYEEIGEEQFTALTQAFQQSKQQRAKMAKKGAKIDYLVNKFATGGPIRYIKYDDRGRWISHDESEERDSQLNGEKNLRMETINDDGHFITDRIDLDPYLRAYRFVHNYNVAPADTAYYFDFGNGHRIGIERDRGWYYAPDGSIPVNKNVTGLLQRMINRKLNR